MQPLNLAIGFLTRLPTLGGEVTPRALANALVFFPWVGSALGGLLWCLGRAADGHLAAPLTATLLVATLALVTGALHLDGVADVFDGLGGGRGDPERMLKIMRDSRIGAHGACAVCLVVVLKILAITDVLLSAQTWALWAAPMLARTAVLPLIVFFPYARKHGLGTGFRDAATGWHVAAGFVLMAPLLAIAGTVALVPAALTAGATLLVGAAMQNKLGGLTGDVYGAAIEIGEIACLVGACLKV